MSGQMRDNRQPGWWWVDNEIVDKFGAYVGAYGIAVYAVLARHAAQDGTCFPSIDRIAKLIDVSAPTVRKALDRLESCKLITVQRRQLPGKNWDSHVYQLEPSSQGAIPTKPALEGVLNDVYHPTKPALEGVLNDVCTKEDSIELDPINNTGLATGVAQPAPILSKKDSPIGEKTEPVKAPRLRDELFDAIACAMFGIAIGDAIGKNEAGRIAAIKKELLIVSPGITAKDMEKFVTWYKSAYANVSIPRDAGKVATHFRQWMATRSSANQPSALVEHPDRPGVMITRAQLRAIEQERAYLESLQ